MQEFQKTAKAWTAKYARKGAGPEDTTNASAAHEPAASKPVAKPSAPPAASEGTKMVHHNTLEPRLESLKGADTSPQSKKRKREEDVKKL